MQWHQRDPFRHPGVADEIEAQLQMQEERRVEAARVAKAEADIARLAALVRWGIFTTAALVAVTTLVLVTHFADLFPRPSVNPVPRSPESPRLAEPGVPGEGAISQSRDQRPFNPPAPVGVVPDRAPSLGAAPDAIQPAHAPSPTGMGTPEAQPPSFTTGTAAPAQPRLLNPVGPPRLPGTASLVSEYQIKAAMLMQFPAFVKWPPQAFSVANAIVTIGVLGDDPFSGVLEKAAGSGIAIRRSRNVADLRGAQIVFISKSEGANIPGILSSFADTNTLTVGETEGFTALGGIIEFTQVGSNIRFKVNMRAADRAGLQISKQLLRLATEVNN
jgi:hypothetical protein